MHAKQTILGVDPGTHVVGFALITVNGSNWQLVKMGVLRTCRQQNHFQKLHQVQQGLQEICCRYKPDIMAIEAPFFGKNVQSMLKLGRAQGVAIAVALAQGIPVAEYAPRKIKQAITSNGNASKDQLALTLAHLFQVDTRHILHDATDALGVALCHHLQRHRSRASAALSWKHFVQQNPQRIVTPQR